MKHTRDNCFKLHGYPDWWHELQAKKKKDAPSTSEPKGHAAAAIAAPQLFLVPVTDPQAPAANEGGNSGLVFCTSKNSNQDGWIIDSGATDHMTFDQDDFSTTTTPRRTCITTANGAEHPVTGAGTQYPYHPRYPYPILSWFHLYQIN